MRGNRNAEESAKDRPGNEGNGVSKSNQKMIFIATLLNPSRENKELGHTRTNFNDPPLKMPQGDLTGAVPGAHQGTAWPGEQVQSTGSLCPQLAPIVRIRLSQLVTYVACKCFGTHINTNWIRDKCHIVFMMLYNILSPGLVFWSFGCTTHKPCLQGTLQQKQSRQQH